MTRRIETFRCGACGRSGARRSPDQRFCSDRCRVYAEAQKPLSAEDGHPDGSPPPKTHQRPFKSISPKSGSKFPKKINGVKTPIFGLGGAPINLLGGYRWPGASSIDRETLRKILRAEIGEAAQ
jgi:hypothetical protein